MRKSRKIRRKSRKTLKNKISHRMRGGGGSQSSKTNPDPPPPLYGIVDSDGRHYVESFYLQLGSSSGYGPKYYSSSQDPYVSPPPVPPPVMLQVNTDPGKIDQAASPRPVAVIVHLLSDGEAREGFFNPTVLSENRYLYSCRSDADTALRQLLYQVSVHATGHPSDTVSNSAKAFLKDGLFTSKQRMGAIALGGLDKSLVHGLTQGLPRPPSRAVQRATTISMLRPQPPQ